MAEGIERPEQAGRLRSLGAEFGQGFHFAPPLTEKDFGEYLRRTIDASSTSAASA